MWTVSAPGHGAASTDPGFGMERHNGFRLGRAAGSWFQRCACLNQMGSDCLLALSRRQQHHLARMPAALATRAPGRPGPAGRSGPPPRAPVPVRSTARPCAPLPPPLAPSRRRCAGAGWSRSTRRACASAPLSALPGCSGPGQRCRRCGRRCRAQGFAGAQAAMLEHVGVHGGHGLGPRGSVCRVKPWRHREHVAGVDGHVPGISAAAGQGTDASAGPPAAGIGHHFAADLQPRRAGRAGRGRVVALALQQALRVCGRSAGGPLPAQRQRRSLAAQAPPHGGHSATCVLG